MIGKSWDLVGIDGICLYGWFGTKSEEYHTSFTVGLALVKVVLNLPCLLSMFIARLALKKG